MLPHGGCMFTITVARSDSGIAFTWQDGHFNTAELTLVAPCTYYGNDCTYVVHSNPTQEVKAMTTYAKAINALTDSQLIDALNQYHSCKLDLTDPEWRTTIIKYARQNWFLEVDEETGAVSVMGEEWQSGFGEFVTFNYIAVSEETRMDDLLIMEKTHNMLSDARRCLEKLNEPANETMKEITSATVQLELAMSDLERLLETYKFKYWYNLFSQLNKDDRYVPFSEMQYYVDQLENMDIEWYQATQIALQLMQFEDFQKSGKDVEDVSKYSDDYESHTPGRVYLCDGNTCGLVMVSTKNWEGQYAGAGAWYLIIGNQQWQSDDLEDLELELFDFACSAGWMDPVEVECEIPDCSPAGEPC
jgi:hypothetical protein